MNLNLYEDIGLPVGPELLVGRLLYNIPANSLIVLLHGRKFPQSVGHRVFVRSVGEAKYREIVVAPEGSFVAEVVTGASAGAFYAMVRVWTNVEKTSADDGGLYRVALPSGVIDLLPMVHDPSVPDSRIKVSKLVGVAPDREVLHAVVGCRRAGVRRGEFVWEYSLVEIPVESGHIATITSLATPFA